MVLYNTIFKGSTMSKDLVVQPTFIRKKHELSSLLKEIEGGSKEAVKVLVDTMKEPPEKVGYELRAKCAQTLLELNMKIGDIIAKDALTRTVAEVKLSGVNGNLGFNDGQQGRTAPKVDFFTVQEIT